MHIWYLFHYLLHTYKICSSKLNTNTKLCQIKFRDFFKFCGLFRIYELYRRRWKSSGLHSSYWFKLELTDFLCLTCEYWILYRKLHQDLDRIGRWLDIRIDSDRNHGMQDWLDPTVSEQWYRPGGSFSNHVGGDNPIWLHPDWNRVT